MRLLHIVRSLDRQGGGPIEALAQRAQVLQRAGHEVEVLSLDPPGSHHTGSEFALTHYLGRPGRGYGYTPALVPWLRKAAPRFQAVTVHGLWQFQGFGAWLSLRGRAGPAYYVFPHGMLDPWFKRAYPLKHLKKWLYWPWAEYRVLRDARAVLFTSEEERRLARESFGLYRARERIVSYGTAEPKGDSAAQRVQFLARFPELAGKRCLLCLGRVHPKKGPDLLLRALRDVCAAQPPGVRDAIRLIMAGPNDHEYGRKIATLARELGLADRVTWTGMLTGDLKWGAFHAAEAFVLPSHQENFGVAVVEAMACGVPVLISNRVNIWREIQADGAGRVDSDDLAGTTRLLRGWLACDQRTRDTMRESARRSFRQRFDIEQTAGSLVRLFEEDAVSQRAPRAGAVFPIDSSN
jgi:glycosyltransferase involved in cell wall biosynthesis